MCTDLHTSLTRCPAPFSCCHARAPALCTPEQQALHMGVHFEQLVGPHWRSGPGQAFQAQQHSSQDIQQLHQAASKPSARTLSSNYALRTATDREDDDPCVPARRALLLAAQRTCWPGATAAPPGGGCAFELVLLYCARSSASRSLGLQEAFDTWTSAAGLHGCVARCVGFGAREPKDCTRYPCRRPALPHAVLSTGWWRNSHRLGAGTTRV